MDGGSETQLLLGVKDRGLALSSQQGYDMPVWSPDSHLIMPEVCV